MSFRPPPSIWPALLLGLVLWLLIAAAALCLAQRIHAQEQQPYTPTDTLAAIDQASAEIGVSHAWLYATVRCETAGSFDPYAVGRQGELGAAQLHPRGELRVFFAQAYTDPFDPYQAIRFMAQEFLAQQSRRWTCA